MPRKPNGASSSAQVRSDFSPTRDRALPLAGLDARTGVRGLALRYRDTWPNDPPNVYAVGGRDGWILVDTGWGDSRDMADLLTWCKGVWGTLAVAPDAIVLTHGHPDHAGGASHLLELWPGAPVLAGVGEESVLRRHAPGLPVSFVAPGTLLQLPSGTLGVLGTPGHTPGSLTFLWAAVGEPTPVAMTGDTVLGRLSSWIGPPDGDLDLYLESLLRLAALPEPTGASREVRLAPGHGPAGSDLARGALRLHARRLERDAEILALLPSAPTARALAQALYAGRVPDRTLAPGGMAERTVLGHLIHLVRKGQVGLASRPGTEPDDPLLRPYERAVP